MALKLKSIQNLHEIADITSKGKCLGTCGTIMDNIVMISHDEFTNTCMCCNDIPGVTKLVQTGSHMPKGHVSICLHEMNFELYVTNLIWTVLTKTLIKFTIYRQSDVIV